MVFCSICGQRTRPLVLTGGRVFIGQAVLIAIKQYGWRPYAERKKSMKKIFEEYGGVIQVAMAIVALICVVAILVGGNGGGIIGGAFKDIANKFLDKTTGAMDAVSVGGAPTEDIKVSLTNLVVNPQFKDGEWNEKWLFVNQSCEVVNVDDDGLRLSLESANKVLYVLRQKLTKSSFVAGNQYYMYARVKYDGKYPSNGVPYMSFAGVTDTEIEATIPAAEGWTSMSAIRELPSIPSGGLYLSLTTNYSGTDDKSVLHDTVIHYNNVVLIDLTAAFGAGNEPDIATMDALIKNQYPNGFSGTAEITMSEEDDARYPGLAEYYLANFEEAYAEYHNQLSDNALTFTMMSDMHLTSTGIASLQNTEASSAWADLVDSDFIMFGGDFFNGDQSKATSLSFVDSLMTAAGKYSDCPVYAVKGNHDTNEQTGDKADRITDEEFYLHANAPGEQYGMVTDPANPYGGYYYVDFAEQKIRMVCLNTTEIKKDVDILNSTTAEFRYQGVQSAEQLAWVKNTALRVPEGWAVMMVSHIPPITNTDVGGSGTDGAPYHGRGIRAAELTEYCEQFAAGTGAFADQGAREFIGHFSGHVHEDSQSKFNGINYVVVNSTVPSKRWDTSLGRARFTKTSLSLNSFIIDRATRTVKCVKIGAAPGEECVWWSESFTW